MNNNLIHKLKKYIPSPIKKLLRKKISLIEYNIYHRKLNNVFVNEKDTVIFNDKPPRIGIIKEFYQYHKSYIAACHDLKISYKLIDITKNNWIENIENSNCEIFLFWPSVGMNVWKNLYDDRIKFMTDDLKKKVYPEPKALWLYENKIRTSEWLKIHNLPKPLHWVFYDKNEALNFAETCNYPIVYKTNIGASANGVKIIKNKNILKKLIKQAFSKGITTKGYHPYDRDLGRVYLQEYLKDVEEWRMIRINDSYFGYRKEKVGEFHSGSKSWSWLDPGRELLDLTKKVTDIGGFTSMDVDIFKTPEGKLYINELQTVFGATTPKEMLKINGIEGRYIFEKGKWIFEPGEFSKNQCSNLRLLKILKDLNS